MAGYGAELMVETARLWASLAEPHASIPGRYSLRGVVGPDEFHTAYPGQDRPGLDNDAYTNIMAAWTLLHSADLLDRLAGQHRDAVVAKVDLAPDEAQHWRYLAERLHLARDEAGLFLPFEHYESLEPFDMEAHERDHPDERLDWFIPAQGRDINGLQVQKQASFAMLVHLLTPRATKSLLARMGYEVTDEIIRATIRADLERTSHDSSLSNLIYAGALAKLDPSRSWEIYADALHPDEKEGHSQTEKGVHLGAMAATLDILQRIHLGLQPGLDALSIDPAPHPGAKRINVRALYRANALNVDLSGARLTITADRNNPASVPLDVCGHEAVLSTEYSTDFAIEALLMDLDGTLTHTDPIHLRAIQALLNQEGLSIDEEGFRRHVSGRSNLEIG
ncbi:hypothetical protein LTR94_025937, partial [Friedmanniomyces endolithicus]